MPKLTRTSSAPSLLKLSDAPSIGVKRPNDNPESNPDSDAKKLTYSGALTQRDNATRQLLLPTWEQRKINLEKEAAVNAEIEKLFSTDEQFAPRLSTNARKYQKLFEKTIADVEALLDQAVSKVITKLSEIAVHENVRRHELVFNLANRLGKDYPDEYTAALLPLISDYRLVNSKYDGEKCEENFRLNEVLSNIAPHTQSLSAPQINELLQAIKHKLLNEINESTDKKNKQEAKSLIKSAALKILEFIDNAVTKQTDYLNHATQTVAELAAFATKFNFDQDSACELERKCFDVVRNWPASAQNQVFSELLYQAYFSRKTDADLLKSILVIEQVALNRHELSTEIKSRSDEDQTQIWIYAAQRLIKERGLSPSFVQDALEAARGLSSIPDKLKLLDTLAEFIQKMPSKISAHPLATLMQPLVPYPDRLNNFHKNAFTNALLEEIKKLPEATVLPAHLGAVSNKNE